MDKYRIIELVMIAVLTIVTTAVVTKLTLNKGSLGVTHKLKARFTPKFRAYTRLIFFVVVCMMIAFSMYLLINNPAPPTRADILFIAIGYSGFIIWSWLALTSLKMLFDLLAQERAERERAQWQPIIKELEETTAKFHEALGRSPEEAKAPVGHKSDSQNPKEK